MNFNSITFNTWDDLRPYFDFLNAAEIDNESSFRSWLEKSSSLDKHLSENLAWRYIKMTCDTSNEELEKSYLYFITDIQPEASKYADKLNRKLTATAEKFGLKDEAFDIYLRNVRTEVELFREANVPLQAELNALAQKYGAINGAMTVQVADKELTLQQAAAYLKSQDREQRKEAFEKIQERRYRDKEELDLLLDQLIQLRNKVASNAGFANYRDYKHKELCRFDYSVEDCFKFHDAIAQEVTPLHGRMLEQRKQVLGFDALKPYDTEVDLSGKPALHPFGSGKELAEKTVKAFNRLDPFFGDVITTMQQKGHLDLESRKGKAPGGYNYPLPLSHYPFIFMNAANLQRDLETMVHEGGHAIHSVLTKDLWLNAYSNCPSEVAELASMSMELISMDVWDEFYTDGSELRRAKKEQLEGVISTLPWIATVDAFQHWLYTQPHDHSARAAGWMEISGRFSPNIVDWSGYEHYRRSSWQRQLHIYEVPFYYIEYGFAQLGAIGVWKSYKENKQKGIEAYKAALSLGNTRHIGDIYKTAGARFDFSPAYIRELFDFVWKEYQALG